MIDTCIIPGRGPARIKLKGSTIAVVESLEIPEEGACYACPGFVDLQINGFAGLNFSDPDLDENALLSILPSLWQTGVTTFLPTLITNRIDRLIDRFQFLEAARRDHPVFADCVPGYHLEGPFLSPGPSSGAHRPDFMQNPDWDLFCSLQNAAGGNIRILTLAPERPGAIAFIERATAAGVIIALSHTDCEPETIHRAVEAGASINTHLGNGCPQAIDRHRAPLWAQLSNPALRSGLICDGFHLIPDFVRIAYQLKGTSGCFLVTDAVHVAGLPPGEYELAGKPIELLPSGKVITGNQGSLAGATVSMDRAVGTFMQMTRCPLETALAVASSTPAAILGGDAVCKELVPGAPANLTCFTLTESATLEVQKTFIRGQLRYDRSQNPNQTPAST